jgi:hypothetical protein
MVGNGMDHQMPVLKSKAQLEVQNQLEERFDVLNAKSEHFLFEMEKWGKKKIKQERHLC